MISSEGDDEEFNFYLKIAKPLILNLPNTNDRIKAAAWVIYLKYNDTIDTALRGEYLKLLLFVLQRRTLYGPFASVQDEKKPLEKFHRGTNIQDVAKHFNDEIDKQIFQVQLAMKNLTKWLPYLVSCSSTFTEYAVHQEIPNFAISNDPVYYCNHAEHTLCPLDRRSSLFSARFSVRDMETNVTEQDIFDFFNDDAISLDEDSSDASSCCW